MPIYRGTTQIQKVYLGNVELTNVLQGIINLLVEPDRLVFLSDFGTSTTSMVVSYSGRIFVWGNRGQGRLGDGFSTGNRTTPFEVTSLWNLNLGETIVDIRNSGNTHVVILTSEYRVLTAGSNSFGSIGDGTTIDRLTPVDITSQFSLNTGENIVKISSGSNHSAAISSTGRVFMWGDNNAGQVGNGTTVTQRTPVNITSSFGYASGETVVDIDTGGSNTGAVTSTGRVFTFGSNNIGQLGDGTTINRTTPTEITSRFPSFLSGEKVVSIYTSRNGHFLALTSSGRLFSWGNAINGQLGDGTTVNKNAPVNITGQYNLASGETIAQVDSSNGLLALTSTGRVFYNGNSRNGQSGDGTTLTTIATPRNTTARYPLAPGETIIKITLGFTHAGALTSKGKLFMWGGNFDGQIGNGKSGFLSGFTQQRELIPVVININL